MSATRTADTLDLMNACTEAAGRLNAVLLLLDALDDEVSQRSGKADPDTRDTRGYGVEIAQDLIADVRDLLLRAYRGANEGGNEGPWKAKRDHRRAGLRARRRPRAPEGPA